MTFNNHLMTHAAACVRMWGPLWAYSLFQFEHANGVLGGLFKGTRLVGMQIVKKVLVIQEVLASGSSLLTNSNAKNLIDSLMENKTLYSKAFDCNNGVTFLGSRKEYTLNEEESKVLSSASYCLTDIKRIWAYKNVLINGKRFGSKETAKMNNCVVAIAENIYVLRQLLLLMFSDTAFSAVGFVNLIKTGVVMKDQRGIFKVLRMGSSLNVFPCEVIKKDKFMTIHDDVGIMTHVCSLPNTLEAE